MGSPAGLGSHAGVEKYNIPSPPLFLINFYKIGEVSLLERHFVESTEDVF